jgi:DNA-binding beta-propeller fold protein YncE
MKKNLKTVKASFVLLFFLISVSIGSCSKSSKSHAGTDAQITTFISDLPAQIMGLTFDSKGNMYVGTYENQAQKRILKITHDGTISTLISIECFAIEFIRADKNDSIYASVIIDAAEGGAKIFKITQEAKMSLVSEGFTQPVGITFDVDDNMFVVDAMAKKVYKISPDKEKTIFIDLKSNADVPDNFYHSIDFDSEYKNLYIAGMNTGSTGNLLKFPINANGIPDKPIILSDHFSKHVVVHNNVVYATVDNSSILIINQDGFKQLIQNPLLTDGGNLSFGQKEFGENTLYINASDKILEVNLVSSEP